MDRPQSATLFHRYPDWLPAPTRGTFVSLGEGSTPLQPSVAVGPSAGLGALWFKCEQANPTGSYKDRFAAMQVSLMLAQGVRRFLATSSGNTGAAVAAYGARAGLVCLLYVNEETPDGKLLQMQAYGAKVHRVKGFGVTPAQTADVFARLKMRSERLGEPLVVSAYAYSPQGMEGVKTIAYEVCEGLRDCVDDVFVPVGGGGLAVAIARGFQDLVRAGHLQRSPRIHAVQPALNDTVVTPLRFGAAKAQSVSSVTAVSGLSVPVDIDGTRALQAIRATGGTGYLVPDEAIWETQRRLLTEEGLYVEPAAAVSVAGALAARQLGELPANARVVCILTGSGFKDLTSIERSADRNPVRAIDPSAIETSNCGA